ncbi:MAG: nitroreductase family protein [Candidatus Micrarchaeota archaeon]|nr:nitroreductase family protein [Candidatus Micrarchaeota archaeon]
MGIAEEAYEAIMSRRSIRAYEKREVEEEKIRKILDAAMCAPSARHEEPWHFIIIRRRETLNGIMRIHPHAKMLESAPVAILVCFEQALETSPGYAPLDCANATMNILHAAHALGLGAVWVGIYPRKERMDAVGKLLSIPEGVFPFALVPLGYPAEKKGRENRYKQERVHYEKW